MSENNDRPNPPTQRYQIRDVMNYLKNRYGLIVTRQTVYNWIRVGIKGKFLEVQQAGIRGQLHRKIKVVSREALDEFVAHLN